VVKLGQKGQELLRYLTAFFDKYVEGESSLSVQVNSEDKTEEQALFLEENQKLIKSVGLLDTKHSVKDLGMSKKERELEGSFYTPLFWGRKAHALLSDIPDLENYVVWDASCGTGNLLIEFPKCKHVYLSTLHEEDVHLTKERFEKERPDLETTVFQLDFLGSSDSFLIQNFSRQLPESLQKVLNNNEKLIILMNPPYSTRGVSTPVAKRLGSLGLKGYAADLYSQFMWQVKNLVQVHNLTQAELIWMVPVSFLLNRRTFEVRRDYATEFEFHSGFMSPLADFQGSSNVGANYLCTTRWSTNHKGTKDLVKLPVYSLKGDLLYNQPLYLKTRRETANDWVKGISNRNHISLQKIDSKGNIVSNDLSPRQYTPLGVFQFSSLSYLSLAKNLITTCELFSMESRATRSITEEYFPMLTYLYALKFTRDIPVEVATSQTKIPKFDKIWQRIYPNFALLFFINRELYGLSLRNVGFMNKENYINPFFFVSEEKVKQAIEENTDLESRTALLKDYNLWVFQGACPRFYREVIEDALQSPYLLPLFKEVYAHLEGFYLSGIRNRRVDSENRLTSAVDLGFHQVKELKEVPKSEVSLFLEHQREMKAEVVKMLQTLNYEI
jgi:hypothetical protein